ncbi:hypothetical protein EAI_07641, partial [Harpegnathos saltator]
YKFQQRKNAAEACKSTCSISGENIASHNSCEYSFRRF